MFRLKTEEKFYQYARKSTAVLHNIRRIDFVFDSYFQTSPKSTEQLKRTGPDFVALLQIDDYTFTSIKGSILGSYK